MFSSYDLARECDVVFSEVLSVNQFKKLDEKNLHILEETNDYIFYKNRNFVLKENDVIFTHSGNLGNLFKLLKNVNKKMNLTLVSHQSDKMIDRKNFKRKPECILNWFALNVDHLDDRLNSLPLGLANQHSYKKNIMKDQIPKNIDLKQYKAKEKLVYINFTESTNHEERGWIKDYFSSFSWASIEKDELSIEQYINKIRESSFVICPWGNGVDSHRIWEVLSLGSIPIVKKHITFENLSKLPILFVEDFKEVNDKVLYDFLLKIENGKDFNLSLLSSEYWINYIKKDKILGEETITIVESNTISYFYFIRTFFRVRLNSYSKKINYYIRKIKQIGSR